MAQGKRNNIQFISILYDLNLISRVKATHYIISKVSFSLYIIVINYLLYAFIYVLIATYTIT